MVSNGAKPWGEEKQKAGEENVFVFLKQHHRLMMLKLCLDAPRKKEKEAENKEDISASVAIRQCSWLRLINHTIIAWDVIHAVVSWATEYICSKIHDT